MASERKDTRKRYLYNIIQVGYKEIIFVMQCLGFLHHSTYVILNLEPICLQFQLISMNNLIMILFNAEFAKSLIIVNSMIAEVYSYHPFATSIFNQ